MAIRINIETADQEHRRHVTEGWQCPECYGVRVDCFENRFGGRSEDRFECSECGCTWRREPEQIEAH